MCYFFQIARAPVHFPPRNTHPTFYWRNYYIFLGEGNTMKYEFRYRLKPHTPSDVVQKWKTLIKTLHTEKIQSKKIKQVITQTEDIVFQLVRDDSVDIEKLVVIRDTLKSVFAKHIGDVSLHCGICFMS